MHPLQFIDHLIVQLNEVEVKGAKNMAIIMDTINGLSQLRQVIHVEEGTADANDHNEQGTNIPG